MTEGQCYQTVQEAEDAMRAVRTLDGARRFERIAAKTPAGRNVAASREWTGNPLASAYGKPRS